MSRRNMSSRGGSSRGRNSRGSSRSGSYQGRNSGGQKWGGRQNRSHASQSPADIALFIKKSQQEKPQAAPKVEVDRVFADFGFHDQLQKNIDELGFSQPTPIQDQVIDHVLAGQDVMGIANTGTGKTGAFLIPLVEKLLTNDADTKFLVITPTRELATQIRTTFKELTQGTQIRSVQCIGGVNIQRQIHELSRNYQAVIGTPGRIIDLVDRKNLNIHQFNVVVLDEVDRMLDMGFVHDIKNILSQAPSDRQSLYFSATTSPRVTQLIREFSTEVVEISVKIKATTDLITQEMIPYPDQQQKIEILHEILSADDVSKVLIFGRTKHGVKKLMFELRNRGFRTDSIHGNKTQHQRQKALTAFRENKVSILVATDVAARGLDIEDVSHVINYEAPATYDDYIHRIGRTGRSGKQGTAYTFVK